jgi:hypothetical protein
VTGAAICCQAAALKDQAAEALYERPTTRLTLSPARPRCSAYCPGCQRLSRLCVPNVSPKGTAQPVFDLTI